MLMLCVSSGGAVQPVQILVVVAAIPTEQQILGRLKNVLVWEVSLED